MTAFGKILVILNLIFAMVTGALIGVAFLTRTNWKANYEILQADRDALRASKEVELQVKDAKYQELERALAAARTEAKEAADKTQAAMRDVDAAKNQLKDSQATLDKQRGSMDVMTQEVERRRAEVKQFQETLADRDVRIRDLEKKATQLRDLQVAAELNYKSLKERFDSMLTQNEEMSRKIAQVERRGIRIEDSGAMTRRPPVENVRGTIKAVDGNLATVSVGTDAGVTRDSVLFIYRLQPQPEYLGELQIISATPFEAVGRIKPAQGRRTVKVGDEVSSNITGVR